MTEHTPTPWEFHNVSGAGLEIRAPVYRMDAVELPRCMPDMPIQTFVFTAPQIVQIVAERWVQFEPTGWAEMQKANAAFIVKAVNNYDALMKAMVDIRRIANGAGNPRTIISRIYDIATRASRLEFETTLDQVEQS